MRQSFNSCSTRELSNAPSNKNLLKSWIFGVWNVLVMGLRFAFATKQCLKQLPAKFREKHRWDKHQDEHQKTENCHEVMISQSDKPVFVDLGQFDLTLRLLILARRKSSDSAPFQLWGNFKRSCISI